MSVLSSKAVSQVDFAIAIGIFLTLFAFLIVFTTNYFTTMKTDALIVEKRGYMNSLLNDLTTSGEPKNWESQIRTFTNESGANWSRSLNGENTQAIFETQIQTSDNTYANVTNTIDPKNSIEITFPDLNIPSNAKIGNVIFEVEYNTTSWKEYGQGTWKNDFRIYSGGEWKYIEKWGIGTDTGGKDIWWNSSDVVSTIDTPEKANDMKIRLYYETENINDVCYFDTVNVTVNYSYYPNYPSKLGLGSTAYRFKILVNNTIADFSNENITVNFTEIGYDNIDFNSVVVYNGTELGNDMIPCNISGSILTFNTSIDNQTSKWFTVYFDDNSNFTQPVCNSTIGGTNNLTTDNNNETFYPVYKVPVLQWRKIDALNRSIYEIMKETTDIKYDFHITLKDSSNNNFLDYGETIPRRGDVYALQRHVLYQNSSAGVNKGKMIVYIW